MTGAPTSETTQLLREWAAGDPAALERLTPRVSEELKRIAGRLMQAERPGSTIQTTALVHEAYLKLVDVASVDWQHRARELLALDDALNALAKLDDRKARVIEMRFFAGLSVDETAEILNVSPDTVLRDWKLGRAWLLAELGGPMASHA